MRINANINIHFGCIHSHSQRIDVESWLDFESKFWGLNRPVKCPACEKNKLKINRLTPAQKRLVDYIVERGNDWINTEELPAKWVTINALAGLLESKIIPGYLRCGCYRINPAVYKQYKQIRKSA